MTLRDFGTSFVSAIIGALLTLLAPRSLTDLIGSPERIALILIALFMGVQLIYIARIHGEVSRPRPRIKVYTPSSYERNEIYNAAREAILHAKSSIRAMSYDVTGQERKSAAKNAYYAAIEEVVERNRRSGAEFTYKRLFQLTPATAGISRESVGERAYEHNLVMAPMQRDNAVSSTKVYISTIAARASVSLIIVDEEVVLVGIPQTTENETLVSLAIELSDGGVSLMQPLVKLFEGLCLEAGIGRQP